MKEEQLEKEIAIRNLLSQWHSEDDIVAYFFWGESEGELRELIREVKKKAMTHTNKPGVQETSNSKKKLDDYLFDTWNMKDTVHNRALAEGIMKWHKSELTQALKELREEALKYTAKHDSPMRDEWIEAIDNKIKQLEGL